MSATRSNIAVAECLTRRRVENWGISVVRSWSWSARRPRGPQSCEILPRMMGRARQGRRRDHQEALRIGDGLVSRKFTGRHKTRDRVMRGAWLQILTDSEEANLLA